MRAGAEAFCIDSPVLPDELEVLPAMAEQAGFGVVGLLATHADWDHLLGRYAFPEAPLGSRRRRPRACAAEPGAAQRELREFDEEHYVDRPAPLSLPGRSRCPCPGHSGSASASSSCTRPTATPPTGWRSGSRGRRARRRRLPLAGRDPDDLAGRLGARLPRHARPARAAGRAGRRTSCPATARRSKVRARRRSCARTARTSRRCWSAGRRRSCRWRGAAPTQRRIHAGNVERLVDRVSCTTLDASCARDAACSTTALERLAADPPPLGRARRGRGRARAGRDDHRGTASAARRRSRAARRACCRPRPRSTIRATSRSSRARRRAAAALFDLLVERLVRLRRLVAGGRRRGARRERGAALARRPRRASRPEAGGCFVQGGTNGNLSALHAARQRARARRGGRPAAARRLQRGGPLVGALGGARDGRRRAAGARRRARAADRRGAARRRSRGGRRRLRGRRHRRHDEPRA